MQKTRLQLKANSHISPRTGFLNLLLMGSHELISTPRPWSRVTSTAKGCQCTGGCQHHLGLVFKQYVLQKLKTVSIILEQNLSLQYTAFQSGTTSSALRPCISESTAQPGPCHVETPAQCLLNNTSNTAERNLNGEKYQMWLREGEQSDQVAAQTHRA